ncbi:glucokinase [Mortierella antarctica]|nr:glucokinase [Mortierella antarctica]
MLASPNPVATTAVPKPVRSPLDPSQIQYASKKQQLAVAEIVDQLTLDASTLKGIKDHFVQEMKKGLAKDGQTIAMVPSYVLDRLSGAGSYLTLDVGGTYLRVVSVNLLGHGQVLSQHKKYKIDEELKTSEAKLLFVDEHAIVVPLETELELGFTFSFPVKQTGINSGTLIAWTKGFSCPHMVGKDPAAFLQDAFHRKNIPVRVAALLNDTVGTLLAYEYHHPSTVIGLGLGTGCNGAYLERVDRIPKWKKDLSDPKSEEVIINMEFGAFDSERKVLPVTMFDNKVDRKSMNQGKQIFEKMIAGMYLGEITRNVLLHLADRRLLFGDGSVQWEMNRVWALDTAYMSTVEADSSPSLKATQMVLESTLGYGSELVAGQERVDGSLGTTLVDRQIVKLVVQLVGQRAARLGAAALAGILEHTMGVTWREDTGATIGVDGSLYRYYPSFGSDILDGLDEIFGLEAKMKGLCRGGSGEGKIRMGLNTEGGGAGAALCALLAGRQREMEM